MESALFFAVFTAVVLWASRLVLSGYRIRKRFHMLPGPPHSFLWGHLKVLGEISRDLPQSLHPQMLSQLLSERYGLKDFFYLDVWPIGEPMLVVLDPGIAQWMVTWPKHKSLKDYLDPMLGETSIAALNGSPWKKWRSLLSPGFSVINIMTLVPDMVDCALEFSDILVGHAKAGDVFRMEEAATRLTVDIIGKLILDISLNTQNGENEFISALKDQVGLYGTQSSVPLLEKLNLWKHYLAWRNNAVMKGYLRRVFDSRLSVKAAASKEPTQGTKYIIDSILDSILSGNREIGQEPSCNAREKFLNRAFTQIKSAIFAGHDTTSSTICYAYHLLQKSPTSLQKIRMEHYEIFGDQASTADAIRKDPSILNKLDYTSAVIKEVLRLYPPASAVRAGNENFFLHDRETGSACPTDMSIWINTFCIHRNAEVWGDSVHDFIPERFLPPNLLPKDAWRPFEKGHRHCIGQGMALLEIKLVLVLTLRKFDFETAFSDLDKLQSGRSEWPPGGERDNVSLFGDEAYQVLIGTAKPRQGMPSRVHLRQGATV